MQSPIQMQLSEKQKTFSKLFGPFMQSSSNFKHFPKKDDHDTNVFPKSKTVKCWVDHSLKNAVSEHSMPVNMLVGAKQL